MTLSERVGKFTEVIGISMFVLMSVLVYLFGGSAFSYLMGLPSYIGVFLLSFVGACSVIIPIPYTAVIFVLAGKGGLDPLLTALSGGLGSGAGEITGWIVGKLTSNALKESKYSRRVDALIKLVEMKGRYAVPLLIFLFALTPLPDDVLFIALGILNYSLLRALIPCIIGKIAMLYIISFFGRFTWQTAYAFGISDVTVTIATVCLLAMMLVAIGRIKWEDILKRYASYAQD